ncbi:glycosyltransferase 87 family protein [Actinocorallia lasiicapitis]
MGGSGKRALASVLGLIVAVGAVFPLAKSWLTNPVDQRVVDLEVYRMAGVAAQRGASVYDFVTDPPQLLPFTYPPFSAIVAIPLAWMSWPVAQLVMTVLIFLALAVVVWYAFRPLIDRCGDWAPLAWGVLFAVMAFPLPVSDQIRFGQVDLFLVLLCVVDCATPRPRWPRGVLIGLATAVKLVPGVFLIYLLITRRKEAAGNAVLTAGGATLFALAALPEDSLDFWWPFDFWHSPGALFDSTRVGFPWNNSNQAMKGIVLRMWWPDAVTTIVWLIFLVIFAYFGYKYARRLSLLADSGTLDRADTWSAEMGGIAITGLLAVLLSPVAWIHHLAWIVLVMGALAGDARNWRRVGVVVVLWVAYFLHLPWWGGSKLGHGNPYPERFLGWLLQNAFGLMAMALVFVLGVWLVKQMCRETPESVGDPSRDAAELGTVAP